MSSQGSCRPALHTGAESLLPTITARALLPTARREAHRASGSRRLHMQVTHILPIDTMPDSPQTPNAEPDPAKPDTPLRMGTALRALGRRLGLTEEESPMSGANSRRMTLAEFLSWEAGGLPMDWATLRRYTNLRPANLKLLE